jgi:hypothetical protein
MLVKVGQMVLDYDPDTHEWTHIKGLPARAMQYAEIVALWDGRLPEGYLDWLPDD